VHPRINSSPSIYLEASSQEIATWVAYLNFGISGQNSGKSRVGEVDPPRTWQRINVTEESINFGNPDIFLAEGYTQKIESACVRSK